MADEKEDEILLEVDIDEGAVETRLIALRKASQALRDEKAELNKANKAGTISADDYAKSLTKNQTALALNTKEIKDNERTLVNNVKQQQAAAGSINQMRAQVSLLYADYAALSKEQRNNAEVGGVMQRQLKDLNDELKAEESAVGDNRRNVGNYAEAIEQAIAGNSNWTAKIRGTISTLGEARDAVKSQVQGYKDMTDGMNTTQKASVALGLGLKAIGIGLLIQAVTALIGFLTKMDAGMDKVEQATAAVSAAFEAFIQTIAPIGEKIVYVFEHPLEALKSFGEALLHPIDTFNKIKTAGQEMAESASANMAKAARAAVEYTKAMQDSEDAQDAMISQQAKVNQLVSIALLATKDRSKTEKERIALLDVAGAAEAKLAKNVLDLRKKDLADLIKYQASKTELQDADRKKLQEVTAAATDAETANLETQQKIQNRRSALLEQEVADRKAAADKAKEAAKKAADDRVAGFQVQLLQTQQAGKDTLAIEQKLITAQLAADVIGINKRSNQYKLLQAKANADRLAVLAKHLADEQALETELANNRLDAQLVLTRAGSAKEVELQKQQTDQNLKQAKADIQALEDAKKITKAQATSRRRLLDAQANASDERLEDAFNKSQLDREADQGKMRLQIEVDEGHVSLEQQTQHNLDVAKEEERAALAQLDLEEETAKKRLQLDDKYQADIALRRRSIQAKRVAEDRKIVADQLAAQNKAAVDLADAKVIDAQSEGTYKEEYKAQKEALAAQKKQALDVQNQTEEEKTKIKADFRAKERQLDSANIKSIIQDTIQVAAQATDVLSTAVEAQSQAVLNNLQKQQDAAVKSAGANADLRERIEQQYQDKRAAAEKEAAEKRRKVASIENIIATAQATTANLINFTKNPILGAITEALILVKAIQSQKLIDSQQFAQGGVKGYTTNYTSDGKGAYIWGPGTGTSDSINAKISNGESILTAKATAMFYPELSAMNVMGGGRAFPGAGGVEVPDLRTFNYGGVPNAQAQDLSPIVDAIKNLQIITRITDIASKQADANYTQMQGTL